jgi:hypothetical protein
MRDQFVKHKGTMELDTGVIAGTFAALDVPKMSRAPTCLVEEHLIDKMIWTWLIPDFSTTTDNDVAVASMTMLATFKKFFTYRSQTGCGFPSVTLLGETRLDLLPSEKYGPEITVWAKLLVPILDRFVSTFDNPDSSDLKSFYLRVAHSSPNKSGRTPTYNGWITAFSYFDTFGQRNCGERRLSEEPYVLDGQQYPSIAKDSITSGMVEVPVTVMAWDQHLRYETVVVAGSVGMEVLEDGDEGTRVQSRSGWSMIEVSRSPL